MRKRVLAFLLAGVMMFNSEGITAFAAEHDTDVMTETPAEEETTESSEYSGESRQEDEKESDTEAAAAVGTETSSESVTSVETASSAETETNIETEAGIETEETVEADEESSLSEETETETGTTEEETEYATEEISVSTEESIGFQYTLSGSNATITGYTGSDAEVLIPDTIDGYAVTAVGNYAFRNNHTVTGVTIPNSVTSIGSYAFQNCTALAECTLGSSLTSIGANSFEGCEALTGIKIPKSVTSISSNAFKNSIIEIEFENGISQIPSNACREANNLTKVTIPATVTSIGTYAFYNCIKLDNITLSDNVETLGNYAFNGCTSMTSISMGTSMTGIGNCAFRDCTALAGVSMKSSVTSIGSSAFENCTSLSKIVIPRNVTSIGSNAFKNSVSEIEFENGMPTIPRSACYGANNLTKVTIPATVTGIGSSAFYGCSKLADISIGINVASIENDAFNGCSGLAGVTLENGLESIGSSCFANCTLLKSITIPKSVTSIGRNAFGNSITEVTFAEGMGKIPDNACYGANKLTKITFPSTVVSVGTSAFYGCTALTNVVLGNTISELGDSAFSGCTGLAEINIPASVTKIGSSVFSGCNMLTEMNLGDGLTSIGSSAFSGCTLLTSLVIPKNVTSIGRNAFYNSVTEIAFAEGMETIPENACNGANKLTAVTIPSTVKTVSAYAFSGCTSIAGVTLRDGITELGDYAFYGCTGLAEINIPASVTKIGSGVFSGCNMLTEMNLGDGLTSIGSSAFSGCTLLTSLVIPKNVTSIGRNAFYNSVTEIAFAEGMEAIPENACNGANKLTAVTIPSTVKTVSAYAFSGCTSIAGVTLRDGITELGDYAFYGCTGLIEIDIPDSMAAIGAGAFNGCNKIAEMNLGDGLTSIGSSAFSGCTQLTSLVIPKNVTSIGRNAFYNSVTEIAFAEGMETIPENACNGANKLEKITLPDTVRSVGSYAFSGCKLLTEIQIPDNTTVGNYCFSDCIGITEVVIGDNVTLGDYIFRNCNNIVSIKIGKNLTKTDLSFSGAVLTGICGDNLTWELSLGAGMLEIKGSGEMEAFSSADDVPWGSLGALVQTLSLSKDITTISAYAFWDFDNIDSIVIPEKVTSIGERAFYSCDGLRYVEIPGSVKSIGIEAFGACGSLEEIVFCGDAPTLGNACMPDESFLTVYYPETATGWIARLIAKFASVNWKKWDNTAPTKDVVLVLDTSGSMSGRMDTLKEASSKFIDAVGGRLYNTRIAIVEYDSNATVISGFSTDKKGQIQKINGLDADGGTAYMNALNKADSLLQNSKADYKVLVMFSDGEPNDSKQGISELAEELRKRCYIYTVGLISAYSYGDSQQRQILIDVAGSEDRYFEASNIDGLVEAFLSLAEDIGRDENTTVEIKRHNERYDLLTTEEAFCVNSPEYVSIYVTPGTRHTDVASVSLVQNDQEIVENSTGEFENIVPGSIFEEGQRVYAVLYDSKGNEIERLTLKIDMRAYFVITYNLNDGTNTIYKTQNVINGEEIYEPDRPNRDGYAFKGWYASESCTGLTFFNFFNIYNRATIEGDVTLYAKWKRSSDSFILSEDAWSFLNSYNPFYCTTKEITTGDYNKLREGLDEATKQAVDDYKNKLWNGSCFGMSSSAVLMRAGVIALMNFDANYTMPGEVTTLYHNKNGDLDVGSIESMINFYHLRQLVGKVNQVMCDYALRDESGNIRKILNKMKENQYPVVLCLGLYKGASNEGGHAVVAYDLQQGDSKGVYTFKVYDCSKGNGYNGNGKEYEITVRENDGNYTKECTDWEQDWGRNIRLFSALSVSDLQAESILTAPSVIKAKFSDTASAGAYVLHTSYGSFTITDGSHSATVSAGEKVSGDLEVTCYGLINEIGEEADYQFELPVLNNGLSYTIASENAGICTTRILYPDRSNGFYSSVNAANAGTVTISAAGEITTSYAEKTSQTIKLTRNKRSTSWYNITVCGEDTGFNIKAEQAKTGVVSDHAVETDISVNNDFNFIDFTNIPVDDTGVNVVEGSNGECRIEKDGKVIAANGFGYSVVFDSQCGTPVDTLVNVAGGSAIAEPGDPQRDGYIFEGWFKEKTCENLWDFTSDKVTDNVVLYAGWSIDANYFVALTFKTPGRDSQTIYTAKGKQIERSNCPAIEENEDQNWYKDDKYTTAWDFVNDVVMENTTLYAKGKSCKVSYVTGCDTQIDTQTVYAGSYLAEPDAVMERDGYTLCGWSADDQFNEDWDFETDKVLDDTTLYVRWVENEKDKNGNDTKICIEILRPNTYVYNGKPITPGVVVRDGGRILEVNKDYKISYKNNTAAAVNSNKRPQVIIQGIGAYKSNKKLTKYFSIQKANIADLTITLPEYVAARTNDKLQQIKPVVRTKNITLSARDYTVAYYKDSELKNAVSGLGAAGTYYIVIEAKKDSSGTYTGNYTGKSSPIAVNVASPKAVLSNAKVSYTKKISCVKDDLTSDEAVQKIVTKVVMDGQTYTTADMDTFRQYFAITAVDADGSKFSQARLAEVLKTAGAKTLTISAVDGNTQGYVGNITVNLAVQGTALNKNQFRLTYDTSVQNAVTSAEYTGKALVPAIVSELTEGTDYTISYLYNKKAVKASGIINAGNYTAVIKGMNQYSGTCSIKFTIKKADLAKACAAGKITIASNGTASHNPAGAKASYTISYDADGDNGSAYKKAALHEGTDYTITFRNNTRVTTSKACAYAVITGKGNFTGTLKGDGKPDSTSSITGLLNFTITRKALSSSDIKVIVNGITYKKGTPAVHYTLYDNGKKIASKEYTTDSIQVNGGTVALTICVPNKKGQTYNYTGRRTETMSADLVKVSDAKKVKIAYKDNSKCYYTGTRMTPEITIQDADGTDISANFTVDYGTNTAVGKGTITIAGKPENGYCGEKVLKFTILPRWMKWIF